MRPAPSRRLLTATIPLLLAVAPLGWQGAGAAEPATPHETRDVLGWTLHVNKALVAAEPEATATAVALLEKQLAEVVRVVPPAAVVFTRVSGRAAAGRVSSRCRLAAEQRPRSGTGPGDRVHEHPDLPPGVRADAELRAA